MFTELHKLFFNKIRVKFIVFPDFERKLRKIHVSLQSFGSVSQHDAN